MEEHFLDNKEQLLRAEDNVINNCKNDPLCLNNRRAFRTAEEKKEYHQEYYENNHDKILEGQKKYRENNHKKELERCRRYKKENKEQLLEYYKQYRENNSQKITCVCGSIITKYNMSTHQKTKKHVNYVNNLSQEAHTI